MSCRAMDLRALFAEMCGDSKSKKVKSGRRAKGRLSASCLARGLKHAGLPLDRAVIDQLIAAFSTSSSLGGRRHRLSYADFYRMVRLERLALVATTASAEVGGNAGRTGMLEEQVNKFPSQVVGQVRSDRFTQRLARVSLPATHRSTLLSDTKPRNVEHNLLNYVLYSGDTSPRHAADACVIERLEADVSYRMLPRTEEACEGRQILLASSCSSFRCR